MGNIDFSNHAGFSTYVCLLIFSGIVMLGLGSAVHTTKGMRALNLLFGVGFVVYGFYLAFLFDGGSYIIFFKAFILPVVMLFKTIQSATAKPTVPPPPAPLPAAPAPAVEPTQD